MYPELKGQTAIVTGAGSNLGRAIALRFADAGCRIVAVDCDSERAAETCRLSNSADAMSFAVDVQSDRDVSGFVATLGQNGWGVDILVNCAGVTQRGRPALADVDEALFDLVVGVNLKGVFQMMKHILPLMVARGAGSIVNVASAAGLVGEPGMSIYSASKHGVIGLTKSAALEYGPKGVRINAVCPSRQDHLMINPGRRTLRPKEKKEADRLKNPASGRAGRADELAATVLFLCSIGAGNIHGAAIPVDGGYTAT